MIDPQYQWCMPIDVTNKCNRACSNCTRLIGHGPTFYMGLNQFAGILEAIKDFPEKSPPSEAASFKLIGVIGGEPLLHPQFPELLEIMREKIPNQEHRGIWTSLNWQQTRHADVIQETFTDRGIHNNRHDLNRSRHSPVLIAIEDVIEDPIEQQNIIDNCWLQRNWCGSITPKGHFFCEVAGSFDWVLDGPGGLPVESECWRKPLMDFQDQINRWCPRCGIALQMKGRLDSEEVDDISWSNLDLLENSPRIRAGSYLLHEGGRKTHVAKPWEYRE